MMKFRMAALLTLGLLVCLAPVLAGDTARGDARSGLRIVGGSLDQTYPYTSSHVPSWWKPRLTISKSSGSTLAGGTVGIFKNEDPWDTTAWEQVCLANGIPYEVHTAAEFGTLNFSQFQVIVVCSVQSGAFYSTLNANEAKFVNYVMNGGFLFFSGCTQDVSPLPIPPGSGMGNVRVLDHYNVFDDPAHPSVAGIPSPIYGTWASHNYFTNLPAGAHLIAHGQTHGFPTLVEYTLGSGVVLASGQTLEYGYDNSEAAGQILINGLLYLYNYAPPFELAFDDDFGRAQLCVNPDTGEFIYRVLTGAGAGEYPESADVYTRGSVLWLKSPIGSPWQLELTYDMATHRATGFFFHRGLGVRSYIYDRNTLDDGACGD